MDGSKVADDWADLTDGFIERPINVTEAGAVLGAVLVWTGTSAFGTASDFTPHNCMDWTSATFPAGGIGVTDATNRHWTDTDTAGCAGARHLYCFEQLGGAAVVDDQVLSLEGTDLQLTSDDGPDVVSLAPFLDNTDAQTLGLSGTILSISGSGSAVSLASFLDNTDSQNLNNVLAQGNDANGRNITNVANITATGLDCPNCVDSADIAQDTIRGNDINDNIYIVHIDCNGECSDMSMHQACDVIENLRGLTVHAELIGVSCVHGVPSTSGNGFVTCDAGAGAIGDNECRAFNLRTLGDIPCIDGSGTDAIVTCLETDIAK